MNYAAHLMKMHDAATARAELTDSDPGREGVDAFYAGADLADNPYVGTDGQEWSDGWTDAEAEEAQPR